jgi:hypothetical protein
MVSLQLQESLFQLVETKSNPSDLSVILAVYPRILLQVFERRYESGQVWSVSKVIAYFDPNGSCFRL